MGWGCLGLGVLGWGVEKGGDGGGMRDDGDKKGGDGDEKVPIVPEQASSHLFFFYI